MIFTILLITLYSFFALENHDDEMIISMRNDFLSDKDQELQNRKDKIKVDKYEYQSDTLLQETTVYYLTPKQIVFHLTTVNKIVGVKCEFSDTASAELNSDIELFPDGDDYFPTQQFFYEKKGYYITIAIEASKMKDRLVVKFFDQDNDSSRSNCPFDSQNILRRRIKK